MNRRSNRLVLAIFLIALIVMFVGQPRSGSGASAAVAPPPPNAASPLGSNLTAVVDYSGELPCVDVFKTARGWLPQCDEWTDVTILFQEANRDPRMGTSIYLGEEGSGHVLVSNAIRYSRDDANWACLDVDLPPGAYDAIDYNVCGYNVGEWGNGVGDLLCYNCGQEADYAIANWTISGRRLLRWRAGMRHHTGRAYWCGRYSGLCL